MKSILSFILGIALTKIGWLKIWYGIIFLTNEIKELFS